MAKTDVIMPQMGESITEGTLVKWLKKIGESVKRDEPLFEISTDKVDAEIPSPAAGVLAEVKVSEGKTVPINTVVAVLETEAAVGKPAETPVKAAPVEKAVVPAAAESTRVIPAPPPKTAETPAEDLRRQRSSPLVRKIAREHGVDVQQIEGSGISGRVTKQDLLQHLSKPTEVKPAAAGKFAGPTEVIPMSPMRKKIAEHMLTSRRTSAHVTTVFEVDYGRVVELREKFKAKYEKDHGVKLTYMAFIAKAVVDGLKAWPWVNASVEGENVVLKKDVNLGLAVALEQGREWGLIVPVIKRAQEKNVLGLARAIQDLAERSRTKKLLPEDVQDGTFTITNPGVFGSLFGTPIINQPQVGILGVGAVEKRVCVVHDMIAIRPRGYLAISYDHRIVDGALADQFMIVVKKTIENFEEGHL